MTQRGEAGIIVQPWGRLGSWYRLDGTALRCYQAGKFLFRSAIALFVISVVLRFAYEADAPRTMALATAVAAWIVGVVATAFGCRRGERL